MTENDVVLMAGQVWCLELSLLRQKNEEAKRKLCLKKQQALADSFSATSPNIRSLVKRQLDKRQSWRLDKLNLRPSPPSGAPSCVIMQAHWFARVRTYSDEA